MSTTCKYCNEPENKQDKPGLICEYCICFVHLDCLRRPGTPGDFSCDVFFDFTCEDCSPDNIEVFKRNKFPWVNVILLTMHHLSAHSYAISNHGYFHYKTHISAFIDRHWNQLFGLHFKQKKNWVGTIAGVLSVYNSIMFQSGSAALGETGWWKLLHAFSPATAQHILQEMARYKTKGRPRGQITLDRTFFIAKVTEMGYKELINHETEMQLAEPSHKRRRLDTDEISYDQFDFENRSEAIEECIFEEPMAQSSRDMYSDGGFEFPPATSYVPPSDSSSINSFHHSVMFYDSDSHSRSPPGGPPDPVHPDSSDTEQKPPPCPKEPRRKGHEAAQRRDTLFSSEENSVGLPWVEKVEVDKDVVGMTQYEEVQLLKQIEELIPKVKEPNKKAYLCRLKAKLSLRRLKRHKHLPVFDVDKTVRLLGGYIAEEAKIEINAERVLDRFQRSYLLDNLSGTVSQWERGARCVVAAAPAPLRSAYSGALLKPYIRRDTASQPLYLSFVDELLTRTNRHIKEYRPPAHATIDYSYVRPHHIAAVNSLCAQFFWPGIDLTEALEYPEFSCVVTYKKLVVGCAFLVPDVAPNEAYISFVLTRPEWRNAKIASFMLYHLLQTCTGKDVTLHVSPTNPAIFLYQKFGFKVEELVQDFYEKYFDMDYNGCRHALYLRLVR